MKRSPLLRVLDTPPPQGASVGSCSVVRATVLRLQEEGLVSVSCPGGLELDCEVVEPLAGATFAPGDPVVVALPAADAGLGIVLGRVTRLCEQRVPAGVVVQASQSLSMQCGQSSIELRADGKVLIKGDEVLVRAKGTKRIRAGTVSIN